MIPSGASLAPLSSLPLTSAHQEAGVILPSNTLISLSLSSNTLLSTELGLSLSLTEGMPIAICPQFTVPAFLVLISLYWRAHNASSFMGFVGFPAENQEASGSPSMAIPTSILSSSPTWGAPAMSMLFPSRVQELPGSLCQGTGAKTGKATPTSMAKASPSE